MENDPLEVLQKFSSFTVAHPQFSSAMDIINDAIETTKSRNEPSSVLLLGQAGTGKTRICDILMARNGGDRIIELEDSITYVKPVICCPVPPLASIKSLVEKILLKLGSDKNNQVLGRLEQRLFALLESCQTSIIILDEWQHLTSRGAEPTRTATRNWVKVLTNEFHGTVILSGTPKSEPIVDDDEQLAGRFPFRAYLEPFSVNSDEQAHIYFSLLEAFSREIAHRMPFHECPALTDERIAFSLYAFCAGNLRMLRILLHAALKMAIVRDEGTFLISDLASATTRINYKKRLTTQNPFELTLAQLKRIVFKGKP